MSYLTESQARRAGLQLTEIIPVEQTPTEERLDRLIARLRRKWLAELQAAVDNR